MNKNRNRKLVLVMISKIFINFEYLYKWSKIIKFIGYGISIIFCNYKQL